MAYCSGSASSIQKAFGVCHSEGIKSKLVDITLTIIGELSAKQTSDIRGEEGGKSRVSKRQAERKELVVIKVASI